MGFIRLIVEECSAKMNESGEHWDDAPVCQPSCSNVSDIIHTMEAQRLLNLDFIYICSDDL